MIRKVREKPAVTQKDLQDDHKVGVTQRPVSIELHCSRLRYLHLKFAPKHLDKSQLFWNNALWSDETKGVAHDPKNTEPIVKYEGGSMIWGCFSANGTGGSLSGAMCQDIYEGNLMEKMDIATRK